MKKIKDYLTLALAAVAFVFITNSAKAQTIQTNTTTQIWSKFGDNSQQLEIYQGRPVFTYSDEQYSYITEREYIWFEDTEQMKTFFLKMKEMFELPTPTGKNTYTLEMCGVKIIRGKNMMGVPFIMVIDGPSYFTWDPTRNNKVLKNIDKRV